MVQGRGDIYYTPSYLPLIWESWLPMKSPSKGENSRKFMEVETRSDSVDVCIELVHKH